MRSDAVPPSDSREPVEEYELPCTEALLAGTLALMTGYSQALQAERDPARRLAMSLRIAHNLQHVALQPGLSAPFRALGGRLATLWQQMAWCTAEARPDCLDPEASQHCAGTPKRVLH